MNSRRTFLRTAGLFGAAGTFGLPSTLSASAKDELVIPALPVPALPVTGMNGRFPVRRIYCVGRNYLAHIRELGHDEESPPFFFAKANTMLVEDGTTIPYPPLTNNFHHEVELVVAIGKGDR